MVYLPRKTPKKVMEKIFPPNSIFGSSFRDPSGSLFIKKGQLLRRVNVGYKENFDYLIQGGLYEDLVSSKHLISHTTIKFIKGDSNLYRGQWQGGRVTTKKKEKQV